jgi:hypothetical protein
MGLFAWLSHLFYVVTTALRSNRRLKSENLRAVRYGALAGVGIGAVLLIGCPYVFEPLAAIWVLLTTIATAKHSD